jgi:hypothetical protein
MSREFKSNFKQLNFIKSAMKNLLKSAIVICLLTAALFGQDSVESQLLQRAEQLSGDKFTIVTKTKKDAKIYAVNSPRKEFLNAIDKGLNELFTVAKKNVMAQQKVLISQAGILILRRRIRRGQSFHQHLVY